jgi:RNA polymerase sigma factor (sigma-70 family)
VPGPHRAGLELRDPRAGGPLTSTALVEHAFRHDYGRLVAALVRRVGVGNLELVEDAVQAALAAALDAWREGPPENARGWLYRVAYNRVVQELRRASGRARILERLRAEEEEGAAPGEVGEGDDLLRLLFVACDETIPWESQLVLALKTLCGFSTAEIALRLFTSEANVHKRLQRARERLRDVAEPPALEALGARLPGVHGVLYLLFNEGYLSAADDHAIRRELCDEALRLTTLLAAHPVGAVPETFALLALMHLHVARLGSRVDASGGLVLLEEQDRAGWDRGQIAAGLAWLERAARGDVFSRYHAEAGIAAAHCLAPSFAATPWEEIAELYAMLERVTPAPSPLHTLNRAVAVAESRGADAGLAVLAGLAPPAWLVGSYLWDAVLADLHRRAGNGEVAAQHRERALASAPTDAIRALLRRRLGA